MIDLNDIIYSPEGTEDVVDLRNSEIVEVVGELNGIVVSVVIYERVDVQFRESPVWGHLLLLLLPHCPHYVGTVCTVCVGKCVHSVHGIHFEGIEELCGLWGC